MIIWVVGIFFSRFLQSLATVMMCLFFIVGNVRAAYKENLSVLLFVSFWGILLVYLCSLFNSENHPAYLSVLKNKIPFFFIPLGLLGLNSQGKQQYRWIQFTFILCCLISTLWSYFQYHQHIDLYEKLYTQGVVMPTLIHHVSLGVLLCVAVLFILDFLLAPAPKLLKVLLFILLCWLVYFIHLLSVRTGIVLVYLSVFLFCLITLIIRKKFVFSVSLLLLLLISGYVSYQKIPNIKSKIAYTIYGVGQFKNNRDTTNQVSDSRRILSDKIGVELFKKNIWTGVGVGDLQGEMNKVYAGRFPGFKPDVYSHIHNQYLFVLAGAGVIAGLLFCVFIFLPLVLFFKQGNYLFSIIYLMLLLVMLWEPFLENQLGTSIYLWVFCLGVFSSKPAEMKHA